MLQVELKYLKTWRLRRRITELKKSLEWGRQHPVGLSRILEEDTERSIRLIRAELERRKQPAFSATECQKD